MSRTSRVLMLLTDGFGGHGGIALYNRDVIKALSLAPSVGRIDAVPRITGVFTEALPPDTHWHAGASAGAARYVATALRVAATLRKGDIVWCAHANLLPLAAAIKFLTGCRIILAVYGTEAWRPFASKRGCNVLAKTDHVVSISQVTADRFQEWSRFPSERISIVANAIDLSLYGDGPRPEHLVQRYELYGKRTIMIFGRMHPTERQKGFDELIAAMPSILERQPDAVLLLAGDGDDRPRLELLVRELQLGDAVRFLGRIDESEKAEHYRLADAFVLPGRQEGFGFVHLEAMACGTPSVASIADGSIEAVAHGALGGLVDPDDPASIVRECLAALGRARGVPEGLGWFGFDRFAAEVGAVIASLTGDEHRSKEAD